MPAAVLKASFDEESLGRRLRRERERRQIAISSIAENTKINASLFEELERDRPSHWPSGIYRRSFIRAYAQAIGVDADATAKEFLERFPDPNDPDVVLCLASDAPAPKSALAGPDGASAPLPTSTLRLTLETDITFTRQLLLRSVRDRVAAVACDMAFVSAIGLALYAALGSFWMPLCIAFALYFGGGVLILGNSPGVCLCAPGRRRTSASTFSLAPLKTAARSIASAIGRERKRYIVHARILTPPAPLQDPFKNAP